MANMEQENAETLHFLLTPFRMLLNAMKVGLFICGLLYLLLLNQVGWITDIGPRSEWVRRDQVAAIQNNLKQSMGADGNPWLDLDVDFRNRASKAEAEKYASGDYFWSTQPDYYVEDPGDQPDPVLLTSFMTSASRETMAIGSIPFCHLGNTDAFDTSLGSWWTRDDVALDRKSSRMQRDYETAALMISALRSTLAHLKVHQSVQNDYGPEEDDMPLADSFCNADGASAKFYTPDEIVAYRVATYQIHLNDAPVVRFRYVNFPYEPAEPGDEDDAPTAAHVKHEEGQMEITGMCLMSDCENSDNSDLMYHTTYAADLFAENPPLSSGQLAAEKALLKTASVDFWEAEARANGITDMKSVRGMNFIARWAAAEVEGDSIPRK